LTAEPATVAVPTPDGYTARHLSVLEGLDAVRKRPGMYIGSTDGRGLMHCLWEIFDNSVDEALGGHCTAIEVTLHEDGSAEVRDNGRGIPVDVEPKSGLTGVELIMTRLHAGGKFGGGSYTASGGLHGVGASVMNALAIRADVDVERDGHQWAASFRRGVAGEFAGPAPTAKFSRQSGLRKVRRVAKKVTGTRTRFWPDPQVFVKDAEWNVEALHQRARQTAYLVPGLEIRVTDKRAGDEEVFRFDGGISEFCGHLAEGEPVTDVIRLVGAGTFTETIPLLDEQGHMTPTEVERELSVDVAVRWTAGYDTVTHSFVNVIATPKGGTHVSGFERALVKTFNDQLKVARLLKNGDEAVTKDDVAEGLTAVVSVRVPEPQFEGQTKEVLGTPAASKIVAQVVSARLGEFLASRGKAKQQARAVMEKVTAAARTRIAAREHRENQRRKSALAASTLPAKLVDCRTADDRSELFIVEGDSALGTAKMARNSEFQALLPIRGKILNVQKASLADMLKNAECASIIQVIGAGSGASFDPDAARYQRVILMSVAAEEPVLFADADGRFMLRQIGPAIDAQIDSDGLGRYSETVSTDLDRRRVRVSPIKQFIRHHHRGAMYRIRTAYGRSVTVTGGHSVFTYEDGELALKPASELQVGDLVVAPSQLPRPVTPQTEIDVAALLHQFGLASAVRIEGEAVCRLLANKAAARQPAHRRRSARRVRLPRAEWARLAQARRAHGITGAAMAQSLGYRRACSVSEFETCRSMPPEPVFQQYLAMLGERWPAEAEIVPSLIDHWSGGSSANERYRRVAPAAWLAELTEVDLAWLASQDDAHGVVIYPRAHRAGAVPRYLPVTEDLCYVLGWYMAEGSLSSRGSRLNFSLGATDDRYLTGLTAAVERIIGRRPTLTSPAGKPNSRHLYVHAPVMARVLAAMGMTGLADEKRLPDLLLNCAEHHQLAFLEGYFLGDGTKGRNGHTLVFATSSPHLANGLMYLLGQLGVLAGLSERAPASSRIRGEDVATQRSYTVTVSSKEDLARLQRLWRQAPSAPAYAERCTPGALTRPGCERISPDLVGLPIREIQPLDYVGDVYDLSVPEDENFISGTGGLLTHNTDADVDGAHIRCLLLTLFHRYLTPMLADGRVFAAVPPLHRIELSNPRKNQQKYIYTYSDSEVNRTLLELERKGQRWKEPVQRYKGLGEMDAAQLAETTMDPRHRLLRRVRIEDAAAATAMFDVLMGSEVAPRRDLIVGGASELDISRIDT
jgi:DNA gyrase subunit B